MVIPDLRSAASEAIAATLAADAVATAYDALAFLDELDELLC